MSESRNFENDQDRINLDLIRIHFEFNHIFTRFPQDKSRIYFRLVSI